MSLLRGGSGDPVVVIHRDIGNSGWLPFYEELAKRYTVIVPSLPGYDKSERPDWMRSVRDQAVCMQVLIKDLGLTKVSLIGLGFGGWIAAEMASMAPTQFERLILVGAMGIKPEAGEILDQALVSYLDYARAFFHNQSVFDQTYGEEPDTEQLIQWDLNREMTFRIAWKPYMYSQTLPHLIRGVDTPSLIIWGREDRVVPLECGERYAKELRNARLEVVAEAGHAVEVERPSEAAKLVSGFIAG